MDQIRTTTSPQAREGRQAMGPARGSGLFLGWPSGRPSICCIEIHNARERPSEGGSQWTETHVKFMRSCLIRQEPSLDDLGRIGEKRHKHQPPPLGKP